MSRIIVFVGGFIMLFFIYLSFGLWSEAQQISSKNVEIKAKIETLKDQLNALAMVSNQPLPSTESNYHILSENIREHAHINDEKYLIEVLNKEPSASNIDSRAAHFPGVDELEIHVTFSRISEQQQYFKILKTLSHLEKDLPMEIISIKVSDQDLNIDLQLYGSSRRVA